MLLLAADDECMPKQTPSWNSNLNVSAQPADDHGTCMYLLSVEAVEAPTAHAHWKRTTSPLQHVPPLQLPQSLLKRRWQILPKLDVSYDILDTFNLLHTNAKLNRALFAFPVPYLPVIA